MTARTCLTLILIGGSVWTLGRRGWGDIGGDDIGQMRRRRYGSKKSDDANPKLLHLSECCSLTFCAPRTLRPDLRLRRLLLLLGEGRIQSGQNLLLIAGIESESRIANESETVNETLTKT